MHPAHCQVPCIFFSLSHSHLPGPQSKMTAKPINVVTVNKRVERHIFTHSRPARAHAHAYVNTRCEDVSTSQAWCSGGSVEGRTRMCSAKLQQTVNIIAGENGISKECLTVSDMDSCFNSSHATVRCGSAIIGDKRRRINISTPQIDEICVKASKSFSSDFLRLNRKLLVLLLKYWRSEKMKKKKKATTRTEILRRLWVQDPELFGLLLELLHPVIRLIFHVFLHCGEKNNNKKICFNVKHFKHKCFLQRDNMHDSVHICKNRLNKSHWPRNLLRTRLYKNQNNSHWPWHTGIGGFPCCEGRW